MPSNPPLTASGPREPTKRPRPIPSSVKTAIVLMVSGTDGCKPYDIVDAAKTVGLRPATLRKYFDRADVRRLLMQERATFRAILCASNDLALKSIRDGSANAMARVAAIKALDCSSDQQSPFGAAPLAPGLAIVILQPNGEPFHGNPIDVTPLPPPADPDDEGNAS